MREDSNIDFGSIQIHKKVLADITATAISDIDGVKLIDKDLMSQFFELLGKKNCPGVIVNIDKNNQVSLEIRVRIRYGVNIPDMARHIQDVVRSAVERTADVQLKDINVNVQGIERGEL